MSAGGTATDDDGGAPGLEKRGPPRPSFITRSIPVADASDPDPGLHTLLRAYEASVWVFACVNCIAANASRARASVLRGDHEVHADHPLRVLLEHPSDEHTFAELLERTIADYLLAGVAYWRLDGGSPPLALAPLRPDRVSVVRGGYEYRDNGRPARYSRTRVLVFRAYSPVSDHFGASPVRPLLPTLSTDLQVVSYLRDFFRKGTLIRGYFHADQELTEDGIARLREEIMESYRGAESFFRPPVLSGGLEYRPLAPAPVDLAFQGWREELRKDILAAFRVPPILLGLDTANFATAREQKATFWNETLMPLLKKLEARIQMGVVAPYADALRDPLILRFLPPTSDTQERATSAT
jgi:HK97 family phage portal protein